MLIYNTTYLIAHRRHAEWMRWVREEHIPEMLTAGFTQPQIAQVLTADEAQDGVSISVQFFIQNEELLQQWHQAHAAAATNRLAEKFGTEALAFSTVLKTL